MRQSTTSNATAAAEPAVYAYVIVRDVGFAPNPFNGWCTLATCKPVVRRTAAVGDWVIGMGSAARKRRGHIVYAMRVEEALSFDQYWNDDRFAAKQPVLNGSLKQIYGDNIYHHDPRSGKWLQADSHHSLAGGKVNPANVRWDTSTDRVLVSSTFVYFGHAAIPIPKELKRFDGEPGLDSVARGHRVFRKGAAKPVSTWFEGLDELGVLGDPMAFSKQ